VEHDNVTLVLVVYTEQTHRVAKDLCIVDMDHQLCTQTWMHPKYQ
jgi:hypothetical protein